MFVILNHAVQKIIALQVLSGVHFDLCVVVFRGSEGGVHFKALTICMFQLTHPYQEIGSNPTVCLQFRMINHKCSGKKIVNCQS